MRQLAEDFGKLMAMSAPAPEPVILAEQGGLVVAEQGPVVLVIDRGNGPLQITAFVLLVITLVFGGFGIVSVIYAAAGSTAMPPAAIGAALLGVGIAAGAAMFVIVKRIRDQRRRPLHSYTPVAVFDRARRVYCDASGQVIAPLEDVRFERRMQLTSSSPKLVAATPGGTYVLKGGNPFGGGIGAMDQVLNAAVHDS